MIVQSTTPELEENQGRRRAQVLKGHKRSEILSFFRDTEFVETSVGPRANLETEANGLTLCLEENHPQRIIYQGGESFLKEGKGKQ